MLGYIRVVMLFYVTVKDKQSDKSEFLKISYISISKIETVFNVAWVKRRLINNTSILNTTEFLLKNID